MGRRLRFILLLVACLAGVALVKHFAFPTPPDPLPTLEIANGRLDTIEVALAEFAAANASYPGVDDWIAALSLTSETAADPFSVPADSEPMLYWSDGRWYAISSYGPDGSGEAVRYFQSDFLGQSTPRERERLLGDGEIAGDIRFRAALYDPTNGLLTLGDVVRWGGPASQSPQRDVAADTATPEL